MVLCRVRGNLVIWYWSCDGLGLNYENEELSLVAARDDASKSLRSTRTTRCLSMASAAAASHLRAALDAENFGVDGTLRCHDSLGIIYIFPWGGIV